MRLMVNLEFLPQMTMKYFGKQTTRRDLIFRKQQLAIAIYIVGTRTPYLSRPPASTPSMLFTNRKSVNLQGVRTKCAFQHWMTERRCVWTSDLWQWLKVFWSSFSARTRWKVHTKENMQVFHSSYYLQVLDNCGWNITDYECCSDQMRYHTCSGHSN